MSINRVTITGNLTRDPELQATQGGTQVLRMGVAVNDRTKNAQTGQWEDRPNFIDCVVFGNRAQSISRFLTKGTKVAVEGRLRWSQWQDRETGKNRSKVEVVVDELEFMSPRQDGPQAAPQGAYPQPQAYPAPQPQQPAYAPPQASWPTPAAPPQPPAQPTLQPPAAPQTYTDDIPF